MMDIISIISESFPLSRGQTFLLLALIPIYFASRSIYRLYFHPLSSFKGPKDAALSTRWIWKLHKEDFPDDTLNKLHKEYDTDILRIGPNELHITDITAYDKIYGRKPEFPKAGTFYDAFGVGSAAFIEKDVHTHQQIRKAINPLFSQGVMFKLDPQVRGHMNGVFEKIIRLSKGGQDLPLFETFRTFTMDAISNFSFGETLNIKNANPDTFHNRIFDALDSSVHTLPDGLYNWPLQALLWYMPNFVLRRTRAFKSYEEFLQLCVSVTKRWVEGVTKSHSFPVIFDRLTWMTPVNQHTQALEVLTAGTDTTALSLTFGVLQILKHPQVKETLLKELNENITASSSLQEILKLEYLSAVVKEMLRVLTPIPGRLPRIVPKEGLTVAGQSIPPGTIVGVSAWTLHRDASIWGDDVDSFRPERWIGPDKKHLESHFVAFSKGPRACVGVNLATAEIYVMLAMVFLRFNITITNDKWDVKDAFLWHFKSTGPRAKFTEIAA